MIVGMWFTGLFGLTSILLRFTGSTVDMKICYQVTMYRAMYCVQCTIAMYMVHEMYLISMYNTSEIVN